MYVKKMFHNYPGSTLGFGKAKALELLEDIKEMFPHYR